MEVVDVGLKLAGILITCTALGSGIGITIGVLEEKSLGEIEYWGFVGTAVGCLSGVSILICALMLRSL